MINIPLADFIIVFLIFLRIMSAFFTAPIFGHEGLPTLVKIFLSLLIAYIVFLTLDKSDIKVELTLWWLAVNGIKEVITGLIIGFMLNFIFYAVSYAGTIIGFEVELSMANVLNPVDGTNNNVIGEALSMGAIMIFFLINGHHYIISGIVYSFSVVHIGKFSVTQPALELIVKYSASIFIIAMKIASPIVVSYTLIYIAEGIMTRVIPQMQVFFVTQPLIIGLGILMVASIIPVYVYFLRNLLQGYENNLVTFIKAMSN